MKSVKLSVVLALVVVSLSTAARAGDMDRQIVVPPNWQGAYDFGYAPALRVGDWVIVSGIPAAGEGTYEEKIRRMYERAKELLEASGAKIEDVVELTTFHVQAKDTESFRAEFDRYMPIHREFFGEHRPAWSAVGTTALLAHGGVVEMRVIAVAGSSKSSRVVKSVGDLSAGCL